ncbi:MAG: hypothetical protein OXU53_01290 [Deltaproteobacteria bacterium]|nr:hypothetical protein [Deltaproteobacteria bacterium]
MAKSVMAAQNAQTAGWSARFTQAVPVAVLTVLLGALVTFLGWAAVSLVDLNTRVGKLETRVEKGFERTDARLTRLETRMDALNGSVNDIYKLLAERLPPPPEEKQPQR